MASSSSQLVQLPRGVLYNILSMLPSSSLAEICRGSVQLSKICLEQDFWNFKQYERFGTVPKTQTRSSIVSGPPFGYYKEHLQQISSKISNLRQQNKTQIFNLIMSAVQPEDEQNVQTLIQTISGKLTDDVAECLKQNVTVSECFNVFNTWLMYRMKGGGIIRGRVPEEPAKLKKFLETRSKDPAKQINPDLTAPIFEQYSRETDPLQALSRAVFDLVLWQEYTILDLKDEVKHVERVISKIMETGIKNMSLQK